MTRQSPTVRRRMLSFELQRFRETQVPALTAADVDRRFGWTQGKTARIERCDWVRPNLRDVTDLLDLYQVTDGRMRDEILVWAKEARQRGWWQAYGDMLSETYTTYIGLEAGAKCISQYQLSVIPGLLQIPEYAEAMMRMPPGDLSEQEVFNRVAIRKARQELLTGPDPLQLNVVLDEGVLRRPVGGLDVWRGQLDHLSTMAKSGNVKLQVLPFEIGEHAGMHGSFAILEFPDENDRDAVYVETLSGELFLEDQASIKSHTFAFHQLNVRALSPADSITMIANLAKAARK